MGCEFTASRQYLVFLFMDSAQVFSRRLLIEPLQNLPRALPSPRSSPTALAQIVGASLLDQPLQDLEVTISGCLIGHFFMPRTALAPRPAQHVQVTFKSSPITKILRVPRAGRVLTPNPLEHIKVAANSSATTRSGPPRTPLRPQPLDQLQVAI